MDALELRAIEKSFGGVHALRGADLVAREGEILGLCGENGAGKSTILKILSGVYPRASYQGAVRVRGVERAFSSTRDAEDAGIAIVHQELMLVPELSVAANMVLGREPGRFLVDDDAIEAHAKKQLDAFGITDVDPAAPVGTLGIGLQQVVEIVRALSQDAKILILDEPTAALTGDETARLMAWLRELREAGTTCIYVSHRMDEIFALCDRVTVLRDGKTVGTVDAKTTPPDEVVSMMVGRSVDTTKRPQRTVRDEKPLLELVELSVALDGVKHDEGGARAFAVENVSLAIRPGEVVAVCGAMGSGRTALLSTLFGCARAGYRGTIRLDGRELALPSPREAIAAGFALVPEDRKGRGLVLGMTVAENLTLPPARSRIGQFFEWLGIVDDDADAKEAARLAADLKVRGAIDAEVATLSGGNQQKIVVGKWLADATPPRVLLLDEPTRGVDVGAREELYGLIEKLTARGTAVLVASSDLPEVLRLAHRIVVLRHGKVVSELDGAEATQDRIVALATGASAEPRPPRAPLPERPSTRELPCPS